MFGINQPKKNDTTNEGEDKKIINIDKDIEENIAIHVMPKKFKTSSGGARKEKTKLIGIFIIVGGILFLIAITYFSYIYLIKTPLGSDRPSTIKEEQKPEEQKTPEPETKPEEKKPEPVPVIKEEPEPIIEEPTPTTTPEIEEPKEGEIFLDSDADGLSDLEEAIFGTDPLNPDSDADGYGDLAEIENLYNPAGEGKLADNPNINRYQNVSFLYSFLYPKNWFKQAIGDESSVVFGALDGSFIQVIAQTNEGNLEIKEWFLKQFPEEAVSEINIIDNSAWSGVFHKNKRIFYLTDTDKKYVFAIIYAPEPEGNMNYYNIFKMAINSFAIGR